MTQRSVTYLKGKFETGDIPTQSDYQDMFDSFLSLEASGAQTISGPIIMTSAEAQTFRASAAAFVAVTADHIEIQNSVSANNVWITGKLVRSAGITVSAAGTTQAAATRLTSDISYIFTTGDSNRAVVLATVENGRSQVVINTAATVALVYPASGCNFVGSAENAVISLAANGCLIAHHIGVSAYGVIRTQGV